MNELAFQPGRLPDLLRQPLELLRGLDPVLGLALLVIVAIGVSEWLFRRTGLPRLCGQMLIGALASPAALRLIDTADLNPWKPLLDLAVGVLLFELGTRIRPRWLFDNRALALQAAAEALLSGAAVWALLGWMGVGTAAAALAGVVAMATSPVITMGVLHEARPRGQVTERWLLLTAVNSVLAVLALKLWQVLASADAGPSADALVALGNMLYVLCGSFLLGLLAALALAWLTHATRQEASAAAVLQLAITVIAALLATQLALSPVLALLVAGMVARERMGHRLNVAPHLGSAGAALSVLLFVAIGLLATLQDWRQVGLLALAIVVARLVGKGVALLALARFSGLGLRQAVALTLALQPMAQVALLLASSTFGWPADGPKIDPAVWQALLIASTLLQLVGPILVQVALRRVAGETLAVNRD